MNTRANRKVQSETDIAPGGHAVVLGGSLAGLLAARILARSCCASYAKRSNPCHHATQRQANEEGFCMKLKLVTEGKRHEDSNGNHR